MESLKEIISVYILMRDFAYKPYSSNGEAYRVVPRKRDAGSHYSIGVKNQRVYRLLQEFEVDIVKLANHYCERFDDMLVLDRSQVK